MIELVFALRRIRRKPLAVLAATVALALGIATTTAIFGLWNALLLRPLPLRGVDRIVQVLVVRPTGASPQVAEPQFLFWREHSTRFESLSAYSNTSHNLTDISPPRRVWGSRVTPDFLSTLGVSLALGPGWSGKRGAREVVLSDGLWREAFAADTAVIGRPVVLDSTPFTVVGVAARAVRRPPMVHELWTPLELDPTSLEGASILRVVGRLWEGVSREQAQTELAAVQRQLLELAGDRGGGATVELRPIQEFIYGSRRATLALLLVGAGLVLILASANVANLQLSRVAHRDHEIAIQRALGAGTLRALVPVLLETFLLAGAGMVAGVALAAAIVRWFVARDPAILLDAPDIGVDWRVALFTIAISLGAALIGGLTPALAAVRVDPSRAWNRPPRDGISSWLRLSRSTLVAGEVAVTLCTLSVAILLFESARNVDAVDPGFTTDGMLTIELPLSQAVDGEPKGLGALETDLLPRLRALPGVLSASLTTSLPLESGAYLSYSIDGRDDEEPHLAQFRGVGPEFFGAMEIEVVRGRRFAETDGRAAAPVAIISRRAAERHWPGRDPVGERVRVFPGSRYGESFSRTVVGVVDDVLELGLTDLESRESLYVPIEQLAPPLAQPIFNGGVLLALRFEPVASRLVPSVRQEIRQHDPALPIGEVREMNDLVRRSAAPHQLRATVLSAFAAMASMLAAVGVYGVVSLFFRSRRRELAIRSTLGATPRVLAGLIAGQGAVPIGIGIGVGVAAAAGTGRFLQSFLFGVSATSMPALATGVAIVVLTAVAAMLPTAISAAKTDLAPELRQE